MKIAVCTVARKEERFIKTCIEQFKPYVDTHLVLVSEVSWAGNREEDQTATIAEEAGAVVVSGEWETEAEQRNFGQDYLSDYDWILIVDADERYTPDVIEKWIEFLEDADDTPAYGMGRVLTYWKDWQHRVDPEESPGLITSVRPYVKFTYLRSINNYWENLPSDIVCHHGSYIRTDEEMLRKVVNFGHSHEIVPDWYENKWLKNDTRDSHPVHPEIFKDVIECEAVVHD